jgi:hypothetical protein
MKFQLTLLPCHNNLKVQELVFHLQILGHVQQMLRKSPWKHGEEEVVVVVVQFGRIIVIAVLVLLKVGLVAKVVTTNK